MAKKIGEVFGDDRIGYLLHCAVCREFKVMIGKDREHGFTAGEALRLLRRHIKKMHSELTEE
jgi:hypothetical protein